MMLSIRKLLVVFACLLGWIGLAGSSASTSVALISGRAKSPMGAVAVLAIAALAFGSFYASYRKRRADGATTLPELYEALGFRFCLTPLAAYAGILLITLSLA